MESALPFDEQVVQIMANLLPDEPRHPAARLVSVAELADLTGWSKRTLYREIEKGNVAGVRQLGDCKKKLIDYNEFLEGLRKGYPNGTTNGQDKSDGRSEDGGRVHAGHTSV